MGVQVPAIRRAARWGALFGVGTVLALAVPLAKPALRNVRAFCQRVMDPKVGESAPCLSMVATTGQRVLFPPPGSGRPSVLVFVGECTNCAGKTLAAWETLRRRGHAIYAVTHSDVPAAQRLMREKRFSLPLLLESTQPRAAAEYNPVFRPRAYVADAAGKLIYVQSDSEGHTTAWRKISALLDRAARPKERTAARGARPHGHNAQHGILDRV